MPHPHLMVENSPAGYRWLRLAGPQQLAADLAARGVGTGVKTIMAAGGLMDRLRAERAANRSAWARETGVSQGVHGTAELRGGHADRL